MNEKQSDTPRGRRLSAGLGALLFLLGGAVCYALEHFVIGGGLVSVTRGEYEAAQRYKVLTETDSFLRNYYYRELNDESLLTGAIDGLVGAVGDVYTSYFTPSEYASYNNQRGESYIGIGVKYTKTVGEAIKIVSVVEGSPAQAAGIKAGDEITAINGTDVVPLDSNGIYELMKDQSTDKSYVFSMLTGDKAWECTAKPMAIENVTATYKTLESGYGYVKISEFKGNCVVVLEEALKSFEAAKAPGVVIDLRDNPGGYVDICEKCADMLLSGGDVYYTVDGKGHKDTASAQSGALYSGKLALLINGGTASASEMFTGAMQDNKRGFAVGQTTYGKGVVQSLFDLSNGGGLKVTSSEYFTPLGRSIQGVGLTPDILVPDETDDDDVLAAAVDELNKR